MKSSANAFQIMIAKLLYIVEKPCPDCGGNMYAWRKKDKEGKDRCAPACMSCGYKSMKKAEAKSTEKMYNDSLKAKAINYLKYSSLYTDKALINCRISSYTIVEDETRKAKEVANRAVTDILLNKPVHVIFSGKSGVGKSHLAMGIAWDVTEKSNFDKKCLFVSYSELLEQLKFAMNDEQARKNITGTLMAEMKAAELLVLDDIGAELGVSGKSSTDYNNDTLNRILEARQNKATVITTNLTGKQLSESYGARIVSRIMKNSESFVVQFTKTSDKRVKGVRNDVHYPSST